VKNGDVISHTTHRHEPPVTATSVGIVHEDEDIIVINKPAGVPVHPAGRYHFNSLVEIMRSERGSGFDPLPCNRLDRLTSGIMFIAKHKKAAEHMTNQIMGRTIKKEYVARVAGEFPEGPVVCSQPILQISPKLGLNRVRANGKPARTVFVRLAYYPPKDDQETATPQVSNDTSTQNIPIDSTPGPTNTTTPPTDSSKPWQKHRGYSIVRCLPLTGRTHQLRVHLQFLGHPITNDPIYCNQKVFGLDLAVGDASGTSDDDIMTRLSRMGKSEVADALAYHDEMVDEYNKRKSEKMTGEVCDVCQTPLYSDPGIHELGIYLHAKRYACQEGKWEYETELPSWALPPADYEGPEAATEETDPLRLVEKMSELELEALVKGAPKNGSGEDVVLGVHPG
jgi:tRNA pseudouridine synthase 9